MADAKRCDNCGRFYEAKIPAGIVCGVNHGASMRDTDLCEACAAAASKALADRRRDEQTKAA